MDMPFSKCELPGAVEHNSQKVWGVGEPRSPGWGWESR